MLLESVEDITVGTRVCNTFEEYPGENFFGKVTEHFREENLWYVVYYDGDEEDMTDQEVLDAANLTLKLQADVDSSFSYDTPNRSNPSAAAASAVHTTTPPSSADRDRARQEQSLGSMMGEFDSLCLEGEATDPNSRQSYDVHESDAVVVPSSEEMQSDGHPVLEDDQCSWCGFRDHKRKTRKACPQHPDYDGTVYQKGEKISDDWVPGTRDSHNRASRRRLTPTSVRSAPFANSWKEKDWTVGVGAIDGRSTFRPKEFTGESALTYPKASLGWDQDTSPLVLVRQFYPASTFIHVHMIGIHHNIHHNTSLDIDCPLAYL